MEGGVKRGLTGSVLVPAENTVTIVAKGPRKRLDSFADWLETTSQLVSKVSIGEVCAPEDVELTSKFEIAAVDPALSTPWREYLTQARPRLSTPTRAAAEKMRGPHSALRRPST